MTLRKSLLSLSFCLFAFNAFSMDALPTDPKATFAITQDQAQKLEAALKNLSAEEITSFSIHQAEEIAGRKLTFKEKVGFKVAKMKMKRMQKHGSGFFSSEKGDEPGISKGLYIFLAIFWPFLGVGLATRWQGKDWLWCLLWSFLCFGGIIYAFVKMKDYYK